MTLEAAIQEHANAIRDLAHAVAHLAAAHGTAPQPAAPAPQPAAPAPQPAAQPAMTPEDVQPAAVELLKAGGKDDLRAILDTYGAAKIGAVPAPELPALLAAIKDALAKRQAPAADPAGAFQMGAANPGSLV